MRSVDHATIVPAMLGALLLAACGSAATAPSDTSTTARVASVDAVFMVDGYVDGEEAYEGAPIRNREAVTTDAHGTVGVALSEVEASCKVYSDSSLTIVHDDERRIEHTAGNATCDIPPGQRDRVVIEESGKYLTASGTRTTVRLGQNPKGSGVRVLAGTLDVVDIDAGDVITVGTGETLGWTEDGRINPDWKIPELSPAEADIQRRAFDIDEG